MGTGTGILPLLLEELDAIEVDWGWAEIDTVLFGPPVFAGSDQP